MKKRQAKKSITALWKTVEICTACSGTNLVKNGFRCSKQNRLYIRRQHQWVEVSTKKSTLGSDSKSVTGAFIALGHLFGVGRKYASFFKCVEFFNR